MADFRHCVAAELCGHPKQRAWHEGYGGRLILGFSHAYHPSCVCSDERSCPLAPPENRISAQITAGERLRNG
ncbi:MAG: DUF1684 domain-containing protein [bacterium]|nr:DUF1684 domain-containing protein [bacterium]